MCASWKRKWLSLMHLGAGAALSHGKLWSLVKTPWQPVDVHTGGNAQGPALLGQRCRAQLKRRGHPWNVGTNEKELWSLLVAGVCKSPSSFGQEPAFLPCLQPSKQPGLGH